MKSEIICSLSEKKGDTLISWQDLEHESYFRNFLLIQYPDYDLKDNTLEVPLGVFLSSINNFREFLSIHSDLAKGFKVLPELLQFIQEIPSYTDSIEQRMVLNEEEVRSDLARKGFDRELKDFQLTNLTQMLSLPSAADFSVPGAGKTTEALAYFFLKKESDQDRLLVVSPINAFSAWEEEVPACISDFGVVRLRGNDLTNIKRLLSKKKNVFVTNYEFLRGNTAFLNLISEELVRVDKNYMLILDESHRMKGQETAKVMSFLAPLSKKKLILTGTPMPQSEADLIPQFNFLYPDEVIYEDSVKEKFQPIFVRTTKESIDLPPLEESTVSLEMQGAQQKFYSYFLNPLLTRKYNFNKIQEIRAFKQAVMRLIQFCSNPLLQLNYINEIDGNLAEELAEEGMGIKMNQVLDDANKIIDQGEKVIIWSSFPNNIDLMCEKLSHHNAVVVHGGIPSGEKDTPGTREYAINQFKTEQYCKVFIANPAAAGEGISLHKVCKTALYLDRTYNAAHYLQSKDRIHRIGSDPNTTVVTRIYQLNKTIDKHIHARLDLKTRKMSAFLNDPSILSNYFNLDISEDDDYEKDSDEEDLESLQNFLKESVNEN